MFYLAKFLDMEYEEKFWRISDTCDCPVKVRTTAGKERDLLDNIIVKSKDLRDSFPWHPFVVFMNLYNWWRNQSVKSTELWRFRTMHIRRMTKVFKARSKPDSRIGYTDMSLADLNAMTKIICAEWEMLGVYVSPAFDEWIPEDGVPYSWFTRYVEAWRRLLSHATQLDDTHKDDEGRVSQRDRVNAFIHYWMAAPSVAEPKPSIVLPPDYDLNDKILGMRTYHNIDMHAQVTYTMPFVADEKVLRGIVCLSCLAARNDIDNVRVNDDNTVSIDMPLELGDSYPCVEGLRLEALKSQARTVDTIYKTMTDLVHSLDNLKEVTDNADGVH